VRQLTDQIYHVLHNSPSMYRPGSQATQVNATFREWPELAAALFWNNLGRDKRYLSEIRNRAELDRCRYQIHEDGEKCN
jgi:hypothetical protein